MRMKGLLGLLAIGGAVAYAQKRRGGEMSFNGLKRSFQDILKSVGVNREIGASGSNEAPQRASDDDMPSYASAGRVGTTTGATYGESGYSNGFGSTPNGAGSRNR